MGGRNHALGVRIGDSGGVTSTTRGLSDIEAAGRAADLAAARSGVRIGEVTEVEDLQAIARLLATIWATDEDRSPVSADLMRAFAHTGNYIAAARLDGRMVGASVGFLHLAGSVLKLHSHITGIAPDAQDRRIGTALKQHQRAWALARGIATITWTFDPLVRRNAWFNLVKLGAVITDYHPFFYGAMEDGVNGGDESDRCVAAWALASDAAVRAARAAGAGGLDDSDGGSGARRTGAGDAGGGPPDAVSLLAQGAVLALDEDLGGQPVVIPTDARVRLLRLPADIVQLRSTDRDLALRWRRALRTAFTEALAAGLRASTMTTDGCYVLAPASAPIWT